VRRDLPGTGPVPPVEPGEQVELGDHGGQQVTGVHAIDHGHQVTAAIRTPT